MPCTTELAAFTVEKVKYTGKELPTSLLDLSVRIHLLNTFLTSKAFQIVMAICQLSDPPSQHHPYE